jgi:hypothetical protein
MLYLLEEKAFICGLAEVVAPQITKKIRSANHKSAKCYICGSSANLINEFKSANWLN